MLLPCLSWLDSSTHVFAFFFLRTVTRPGFALSVCPHRHHQNNVKGSMWEGEREWETVREGERQISGCFVGNTVKRSTVHGAPSAEHTSKPVLHLYCQHLGEERRGARVEQPLSSAGSLPTASPVDVPPLSSPLVLPNCLCALPHFFTFTQFRFLLFR